MRIGAILQGRMGSTRLPGKVLMTVDNTHPVLYYVLNQLGFCNQLDTIIVATTTLKEDDKIAKFVESLNIECFRGHPSDVLDRYYHCAKKYSLSTIVRITCDDPLIDPTIVDMMIDKFDSDLYDIASNCVNFDRTYPAGTEVEVFSFNALEKAWKNAIKSSDREHVTPYFYNQQDKFKLLNVKYTENISHLGWTVDRIEDLDLVRLISTRIKKRPILMSDILELFSNEPSLIEINKGHNPHEGLLKSLKEDQR